MGPRTAPTLEPGGALGDGRRMVVLVEQIQKPWLLPKPCLLLPFQSHHRKIPQTMIPPQILPSHQVQVLVQVLVQVSHTGHSKRRLHH